MRAILRASRFGNVSVMYPVVSGLEELRMAKMLFDEVRNELHAQKVTIGEDVRQGAMIEVPSAALVVDLILKEADFISIGTNDLTQYVLAINRNSESLAPFFDPFHPAMIRALRALAEAAARAKKPVSICGEMAGDLVAARLLIGLGFRSLSMVPVSILPMKELVRSIDLKECRHLALAVLKKETAWEVRNYLLEAAEAETPAEAQQRRTD